ncbi:2OG-Fe(II) oxygenase family protein [Streptomyces albidoflavus]|uniref:2OG-Fe(II) oxygenase family protein n=1 Tax=Streptomyces albidoflavus TaxID=1886 RepID=UPI001020169B|nr:2OG-Fe(II) oxygenase family protein [Streptomyces albidoflavus]RZE82084.1 2OG-Fe(II) oxygenase [Streptomyces albidoflavus]
MTTHQTDQAAASGARAELDRERRMGTAGEATADRQIQVVDLGDFETRRAEITEQLWQAATGTGFFQLSGHGLTSAETDAAFAAAEAYFALPAEAKAGHALKKGLNAGWEYRSQVRPSTGTPDEKESYQLTRPHMDGLWPAEEQVPGFRATLLGFEARCHTIAHRVLSCFAERLGFERDFFARLHDPASPLHQSTLRLLHYYAVPEEARGPADAGWRAGAHTDFDCLTLLFQRDGQDGLQVCPGQEAEGRAWTPVRASSALITCNIGDMLTRWSGDRLPSNFHRVAAPGPGDDQGPRYSIAYFAQADRDAVIASPDGRHAPITAEEYLRQRIAANFAG